MSSSRVPTPRVPRRNAADPYDDIEPWLDKLAGLSLNCPERARLREVIIGKCLPLGEHIARRYSGRGVEFDDLSQVAAVGVVLAVDRFDPHNGASFLSFAIPTIMGEVKRHFRDHAWAVRVPRAVKELQQHVTGAVPQLFQQFGRQPTARELSAHLDVDITEITQALIAGNCFSTNSLDTLLPTDGTGDTSTPLGETLPVEEKGYTLVDDALSAAPLLSALAEREIAVLAMRYGQDKSQSEIGAALGVSQMQVSRILSRTLQQLRDQTQRR
ncbi:SigB/SigF/SigG family RNA polymerase sigma factor [Nocardia sp. NPDC050712]|uniref:SigB/SigF/SigG family RNA polymerase sigma factor n=1 Tax=Nocardia sp. NPDC050712 TaxID=3155518 RepID=UPI003402F191